MAPEEDLKKRVARKLTKRRREGHHGTMDIPERFRDGDDAEEDHTAPPESKAYMNQSVFGMIAAAGSQVDFNARFDGQSSDEEEESEEPSAQSSEKDLQVHRSRQDRPIGKSEKHKRKFSEHKLLRSITSLGSKSKTKSPSKSSSPARRFANAYEAPEIQVERITSHRDAPVMSRMLEAEAELSIRPSFDMKRPSLEHRDTDGNRESITSSLAKRLMEIFEFDKAEDVIEGMACWLCVGATLTCAEYPCWLLKSVLLQGYMYITTKHICFYAYLPKKSVSCRCSCIGLTLTRSRMKS